MFAQAGLSQNLGRGKYGTFNHYTAFRAGHPAKTQISLQILTASKEHSVGSQKAKCLQATSEGSDQLA